MDWMKKGEKFLPKYNIEEVKKLYQKEKDAKAKLRLSRILKSIFDILSSIC